jgi:transcriptional regulator with XRE-family HTH domain
MLLQSEATDRAACIRSSWQASFYPDRPGIPGKQGLKNEGVSHVFSEGCGLDYRKRLKELRKSRNLSQAQVGKVIFKGQQGYSHIETGRANLKIDDLKTLSCFFGVSADYLIGLTDDPGESPRSSHLVQKHRSESKNISRDEHISELR